MKKIYLLTGYDGFYGQSRKPWVSIDTALFVKELQRLAYTVEQHEFHEVVNGKVEIKDSVVLYSFSHRENLHHYIRDSLRYLMACGNTLLPSFELFCCHENKGWQELWKRTLGIHSLDAQYFSHKRELDDYDLSFPLVFKTLTGSNSTGVALVHSKADIHREIMKHRPPIGWGQRLDFWRRKHLRMKKEFPGYPNYDIKADALWYQDYMTRAIPFVLQEFIPGLSYDYRVIVLGDRYFISKRHTKAGDFRASGAKLFDFKLQAPEPILDKAKALYESFKAPFLSIDLGEDASGKLYLFEYQASHFGINAIVRGRGYYRQVHGEWQFTHSEPDFERYLAEALDGHLTG